MHAYNLGASAESHSTTALKISNMWLEWVRYSKGKSVEIPQRISEEEEENNTISIKERTNDKQKAVRSCKNPNQRKI